MTVFSFGQLWSNVVPAAKFLMAFCLIWPHRPGVLLSPFQHCRTELGNTAAPVAQGCSQHEGENEFLYGFFHCLLFFKTPNYIIWTLSCLGESWLSGAGQCWREGTGRQMSAGSGHGQRNAVLGPAPGGTVNVTGCWWLSHVDANTSRAV